MKRILNGLGYTVGGLVLLGLIGATAVYGLSESRMGRRYAVNPPALAIPTDSASVARGEHLARSIAGCTDCHGQDLGGQVVIDDAALGRVFAKNLTRGKGGVAGTLRDVDYVRAIRHGLDPDGKPLKVMPSSDYSNLADDDLAAIIAFVKSRPPVDKELPAVTLGPVGRSAARGATAPRWRAGTLRMVRRTGRLRRTLRPPAPQSHGRRTTSGSCCARAGARTAAQ